MAGHSHAANIARRKGAQDKKRASLFTKVVREVMVAAKLGGPDTNFNPRLRTAVLAARAVNVPKDRIEAAIKKGSSASEGENYEEMRYEAYAPGGVAVIIDALTDNRNRTASDLRAILTKYGGALGEQGCVSFMFERLGMVFYPVEKAVPDAMFEAALEAGASNCESSTEGHMITCELDQLNAVRDALTKQFGDPETARFEWQPKTLVPVTDEEKARAVLKLVDALEDNDDVQYIATNYDISDSLREKCESA